MMASNLNKESSLKTIDDIFNFINSNENDAQKYLIDIKFIKEKTLNDTIKHQLITLETYP